MITSLSRLDLLSSTISVISAPNPEYSNLLLDLVGICREHTAFIITSNISLEDRGAVMGDPVTTNASIDRLLHQAHVINIRPGRNYRTQGPGAPKLPVVPSSDKL